MKQVKIAVLALLCALLCACGRQSDLTAKAAAAAQSCAAIAWKVAVMRPAAPAEAEAAPEEIAGAPEEIEDESEPVSDEWSEVLVRSAGRNYNLTAYYHPIEKAYLEEDRTHLQSNADIWMLYEKYADLWAEECAVYQAKIEAALADHEDALAAFQAAQKHWETQLEAEMSARREARVAEYTTGTIVGFLLSEHWMELWRARAMELIDLYLDVQYEFLLDPEIDWLPPVP